MWGIGYLVVFSGPESWRGFRLKDSFKVCRSLTKLNWTSVVSVRELDLVLKMEMRLPKSWLLTLYFTDMFIFLTGIFSLWFISLFYLIYFVKTEYREEKQNWKVPTEQLSWDSIRHIWSLLFRLLWPTRANCLFVFQTQQITPQLALQVLLQFDKAINTALANRVRNRVNFRVSAGPGRTIAKTNQLWSVYMS